MEFQKNEIKVEIKEVKVEAIVKKKISLLEDKKIRAIEITLKTLKITNS